MNHLAEAERRAERATCIEGVLWAQTNAQLAIAHALIAQTETNHALIALVEQLLERLPPPAETWSECGKRLRKEEQNED